jgi:hypothetical protein
MPGPICPDAVIRSATNLFHRFWSFESLTVGTAFRLVLLCWICSWFAIYVPLVLLAPILGIENVSVYLRTLVEFLWGCAVFGGLNTVLFAIYLLIWIGQIWKDRTLYTRRLCAIVYGAIFLVAPTSALFAAWYWVSWKYLSSEVKPVGDWGQGLGVLFGFVLIVVQPIGLILGTALGYALGRMFERRGVMLSDRRVVAGTLGFSVLLIASFVAVAYVVG